MGRTLVVFPSSDVAVAGIAIGAVTYYGCVAQRPHDGDATRVRLLNQGDRLEWGLDFGGILPNEIVTRIDIEWAAQGSQSGASDAQVGFRIAGADHLAAARDMSAGYVVRTDPFQNNPATGIPWTRVELVAGGVHSVYLQGVMQNDAGYPRLSGYAVLLGLAKLPISITGRGRALRATGVSSAPRARRV